MTLLVYVAAPFADAAIVRGVVHPAIEARGMVAVSRWAHVAGKEEVVDDEARAMAVANDADLRSADAVLVLARPGAGGEMFSEARLALEWGKPLVWVGRKTLSAWRPGVVRVVDLDAALVALERMKRDHANGIRGHLLALVNEDLRVGSIRVGGPR